MDGNDRDESANPLPTLGGLLDLKDWLTLGETAKVLARRLGDEVSEADVLRLGLDGRLVLSVRFVNGTDARRGRLVPGNQATYSEVPSLDGQRTVRLYRGPQLNNGDVIELEEGIVALRGVFDLPMIGGELHTVEAEYQRRAVAEQATWAPSVEVTDVAMDGAFVSDGASYFQLQDWLEDDGFDVRPGKGYLRRVRSPYPRGDLPEDTVVVVRPGPLRELLARMNAEAKPLRFVVPLRPREIPGDLLALPSDARVQYVNAQICGRTGEGITNAGDLVEMIRDTIARQNNGWLTIEEAAQLLEDAGRGCAAGKDGWVEKLSFSARVGILRMHQPVTLARINYGAPFTVDGPPLRTFHEWAHVDDLNRWLEANEPRLPFRFDGAVRDGAARAGRLSREEWAALSNDEKASAFLRGEEPERTPEEDREQLIGWYDSMVKASYWLGLARIKAAEAAQLLACCDPLAKSAGWLDITSPNMAPDDRRALLRGFEDVGGEQSLKAWLQLAKDRGWRYDPWIDEYISAAGERLPEPDLRNTQSETTIERQARRHQMCIDAGLTMPTNDYARLPRGISALAEKEGISRQAFSEDVKAHIRRVNGR